MSRLAARLGAQELIEQWCVGLEQQQVIRVIGC
jgi:hypothetical protein